VKQAEAERQRAETERRKAEQAAAAKTAEAERLTVAAKRAEDDRLAKLAETARLQQEATCKREESLITGSQKATNRAKAREDLARLEYDLTCQRLRPDLLAALDKLTNMPEAPPPASPDAVRAAQQELARLGCFAGPVDGNLTDATKDALKRYQTQRGRSSEAAIDDDLVSDLKGRRTRICPLVCPPGRVAEGEQCVVAHRPPTAPVARQNEEPQRRQNVRQEREERPQPRVRQEAAAPRNSGGGGGGGGGGGRSSGGRSGGGGGAMSVGVGF